MSINVKTFPYIPLETFIAMHTLRVQLLGTSRNAYMQKYYYGEFKYKEVKPKFIPGQWVMFFTASGTEEGPYTILEAYKHPKQEDFVYVIGKLKSRIERTVTFDQLRLMTQTEVTDYASNGSTYTFGIDLM